MTMKLFLHPFSSYCQKAIIAFYENDLPFEIGMLDGGDASTELSALWPLKRFPVLQDDGQLVPEATIIIEHLHVRHPGPVKLIPDDPAQAVEVRLMDRFFDNYIGTPQGQIVFNQVRPVDSRDPYGVAQARTLLDTAYRWLDGHMAGRRWATGDSFSMADCAAAPHLLYADWTHPIPREHVNVHAYRARLIARPSYARALDEARPYRHFFPLGAPTDRD